MQLEAEELMVFVKEAKTLVRIGQRRIFKILELDFLPKVSKKLQTGFSALQKKKMKEISKIFCEFGYYGIGLNISSLFCGNNRRKEFSISKGLNSDLELFSCNFFLNDVILVRILVKRVMLVVSVTAEVQCHQI